MKKILALLVMAVLCATLVVAAAAETFVNPVAPGADPFVLKDDDGMYYLYVTSPNEYGLRVFSSTNLVEWEGEGYCLIADDVYYEPDSDGKYNFWAPEVIKYEGTYYMVYTTNNHIGIATSDSPLGPFTNDAENEGFLFDEFENTALYPKNTNLRVLDGHFFLDNETMYFYFVTVDNASFGNGDTSYAGSHIWGCEFDMETLKIKGETINRVQSFKWPLETSEDERVVEAPFMIKNGNTYYLTFSSGEYKNTDYAVCCATSNSPLGEFTRYAKPILECDDLDRTGKWGDHLYGTGHHSFVKGPDGELCIVYHAHRTGWTYGPEFDKEGNLSTVTGRVVCIDKAGFDGNTLWAGSIENKGVPTVGPQDVPFGATLEREFHAEGVFADIPSSTIYVAHYDGLDTNVGTDYKHPVKTIEEAIKRLPNGGTVALIQDYTAGDLLDIPALNGPLVIKAAEEKDKDILFSFKFIKVNTDVYFDNLIMTPITRDYISLIECNFNNVVFGDGISTLFNHNSREFPYIVGGKWWYTGKNPADVYNHFKYDSASDVTSNEEFSVKVYSGTWEKIFGGSMKVFDRDFNAVAGSAANGELEIYDDVIIRPAKVAAPTLGKTAKGISVTFKEVKYATTYQIIRNGEVIGYSDTTTYIDEDRVLGKPATYSVRAYANGCCIGASSAASTITTYGDIDADGDIDLHDALGLIDKMLNNETEAKLVDLLAIIGYITK